MNNKSIASNAVLNLIKTICGIIFPLVTFPYISRVLRVENIGIVNYCSSIVSYFALLAGLGINTYAIREGSRYRNESEKISKFSSEVYTINLFSTALAYALLIIVIVCFSKLQQYQYILLLYSVNILFTTIGCEWIFNVYEDFLYITIRNVAFQILSMILLFCFVDSEEDLIIYIIISIISSSGANLLNAFYRNKYCKIKPVINIRVLIHLLPILIIFASTVTTTIYVNFDTTMLGWISGTYYVGLYSVSTRLYSVVKSMLSAIIIVSIPRLSSYLGTEKFKDYSCTATSVLNAMITFVVPAFVGLFSLSKNAILIISGEEYIDAVPSLKILSFALLFSMFSWFFTSCVLIPFKKETNVLIATVVAALTNIVLNIFLIPKWRQNGAALTTVIAELISMILCCYYSKKYYTYNSNTKDIVSVIVGNISILLVCALANRYIESLILSTILAVIVSVFAYFIILFMLKNTTFMDAFRIIKGKIFVSKNRK